LQVLQIQRLSCCHQRVVFLLSSMENNNTVWGFKKNKPALAFALFADPGPLPFRR
jgi:hypothetical protein